MTEQNNAKSSEFYDYLAKQAESIIRSYPEVSGISADAMQSLVNGITQTFGRKNRRGISISHSKIGLTIEGSLSLVYGCVIHDTCRRIQSDLYRMLSENTKEPIDGIHITVSKITAQRGAE